MRVFYDNRLLSLQLRHLRIRLLLHNILISISKWSKTEATDREMGAAAVLVVVVPLPRVNVPGGPVMHHGPVAQGGERRA